MVGNMVSIALIDIFLALYYYFLKLQIGSIKKTTLRIGPVKLFFFFVLITNNIKITYLHTFNSLVNFQSKIITSLPDFDIQKKITMP